MALKWVRFLLRVKFAATKVQPEVSVRTAILLLAKAPGTAKAGMKLQNVKVCMKSTIR